MRAQLKSILVISLLVFAGFVMVWNFGAEDVNVQGAVRYVGDDSTYKTIQAAVDNAISGDTIYVKNDTYYESVTINTANIELIGNSTTDCTIEHYHMGTSWNSDYAAAFNVTQSGVTITGFNISTTGNYTYGIRLDTIFTINSKIYNNNITTDGGFAEGIFISAASNNKITNNNITTLGDYSSGIFLRSCTNNDVMNNTLKTYNENSNGIYLRNYADDNYIYNNTIKTYNYRSYGIFGRDYVDSNDIISNIINTTGNQGHGIYLALYSNLNYIFDNEINTSNQSANGIRLGQDSDNTDVIYNTINVTGSYSYGISIEPNENDNNIFNNTIITNNSDSYGIYLSSTINNTIYNNTINTSGEDGYGIYLYDSLNNNLTGNNINTTGQNGFAIYISSLSNKNNITWNTITTYEQQGYGINIDQNSDDNNATHNTIDTFGTYGHGITIMGGSDNNDIIDNTINTSNSNAWGINVASSLNNDLINNTIKVGGSNVKGIRLYQSSFYNDIFNNTITTLQGNSYGIYLQFGPSNNNVINNTINTSGLDSYGIYHWQASDNNITDNTIGTSGQTGHGIFLEQNSDNNNITDNTIYCNGTSAVGIRILSGSHNDIVDNKINTTISARYGIYLWSSSNYNNITDNKINTSGVFGYGVIVGASSNNDILDNEITTLEPDGIGIIVTQKSYYNDLENNEIKTHGSDGYGIYLNSEADFNNITTNTIETYNWWSHGLYINPNSINNSIIDNTINISGNSAHGIYINVKSNDSKIINNTINIMGNYTHGFLIQASNNTFVENCNISTDKNNAFGIYLDGNFATFINTSISASEKDFYITNDGNLSAINCSFNDSKVDVEQDGGGVLQVKNYLTIQAYYDDAITPIPAADILVKDNWLSVYNTSGYGGTDPQTNVNGRVANIISSDRWFYYNNVSVEINNNVSVKKTNAASWEETRAVDMNTSHTEIFIATDIIGPTIPTGLKVVQETPGVYDLNISWDPNTDDTVTYSVYKFNYSVFQWELLINLTHPTNWTLDQNLLDGMWHLYRVEAWDGNGFPSGVSGSVSHYFPDLTPPATPTGLTVTPVPGGDALNITWNANTDDTVKYEFWYFNPHAQNWFRIANQSQSKNWFLFEYGDLINGTKYFFRVRAYDNADHNSSFAVANGTHRDYLAPVAPTNLTAETRSETSIYLSWNRSTDLDVEGYRIYVNQSGAGMGGPYTYNNVVDGSTYSYEVTNLIENETYYFVVLAFDEANNPSLYSNESKNTTANVAPLAPSLDSLPALTNNSILWITGTALNLTSTPEYMATVQIFINDQFANEGLVNTTGHFSIVITLAEGTNSITAKVIDRADNPSGLTEPVEVILDTQEPIVDLDEFVEYTNTASFYVTGTTENNSKVFVYNNGILAKIGYATSEGKFKIMITLAEGANSLTANALDPAQNNGSISAARVVILDLENPGADAGTNISIYIGDNATLNGSGSTDNWVIANYTWSFDYGGNNIVLYGQIAQFQFDLEDVYDVTLTVTDGAGNTGEDTLWVAVSQLELDTEPPVAHAGPDQTVEEGTEVKFNGSASIDNDAISNFTWEFTYDGDTVTLYGMNPTFVFDISGDYQITLTVSDFALPPNTDTDALLVKVIDSSELDSDGDGMDDAWEDNNNLNKFDPSDASENYDGDNLTNIEEYENGTNPRDSDSDGDQLPDDWELANNLDPTDEGSVNEINGASGDPDDDGFTNLEEFRAETDPQDSGSHPKKAEDKDDDEDYLMYIIIMIIAIIILIIILGLAMRKPVSEEELLAAEEEEELPSEEPGMESGVDEGEGTPPIGEGDFECPTCGAILTDADTVCPECGEEFEDDEE